MIGAIKCFTSIRPEAITTRNLGFLEPWEAGFWTYADPIVAGQIARHLSVRHRYISVPGNLYQKYFTKWVFLTDGMYREGMWLLPLVIRMRDDIFVFDGLGIDILLGPKIWLGHGKLHAIIKEAISTLDYRRLALTLQHDMQRKHSKMLPGFFRPPACKGIEPSAESLIEALKSIGAHENLMIAFRMGKCHSTVSLMPQNMIGSRTQCLFPLLDNELAEFVLSIPPIFKMGDIYWKVIKSLFPGLGKLPSSNFYLRYHAREWGSRRLILVLRLLRYELISRLSSHSRKLHREAVEYLINLMDSLTIPPFLDAEKLARTTQEYLRKNKDPMPFLVPLVQFCVWHNLFFERSGFKGKKSGFMELLKC